MYSCAAPNSRVTADCRLLPLQALLSVRSGPASGLHIGRAQSLACRMVHRSVRSCLVDLGIRYGTSLRPTAQVRMIPSISLRQPAEVGPFQRAHQPSPNQVCRGQDLETKAPRAKALASSGLSGFSPLTSAYKLTEPERRLIRGYFASMRNLPAARLSTDRIPKVCSEYGKLELPDGGDRISSSRGSEDPVRDGLRDATWVKVSADSIASLRRRRLR